jgi:Bifunctional DNA primase/polymerase, N-terminal
VYSATIDPAVVGRDFGQNSNALIAVPMGRRTGVFAIDVDASPPHAHDGVAAWQALEGKHGATPTRIHLTSTGGLHLLFLWPQERPVGCAVKGLPKGVECKGECGSIIFPPSERGDGKYSVVSDIDPAHAPDWLLDMVAPVGGARPATPRFYPKTQVDGEGSPYGLKALDNACAKLARAGPGERDRAVGENALAIGSLAAGGELDERHALQSLKHAAQSNPGSDANYCDKIERAFETGKENPRSASPRRSTPKRAAKQRSNPAETPKRDIGNSVGEGSCPSCPSYP